MVADFISFLSNSLTITVLLIYVFVLWAALVIWTWLDVSSRTDNILYRLGATLIVVFGSLLGVAIYVLLRPGTTKEDNSTREIEEAIIASQSQLQACPNCYHSIRRDFSFCPSCSHKLTVECNNCQKKINQTWNVCPYCGERQRIVDEIPAGVSFRAKIRNIGLSFYASLFGLVKSTYAFYKSNQAAIASEAKTKSARKGSRKKKS